MNELRPPLTKRLDAGPLVRRVLGLTLLWWSLTGGQLGAWWFLGPVILAAAALPRWLPQPESAWRMKLGGLLGFVPFFLHHSIKGGWDVARRALLPGPRLEPGLYHHHVRLPSETARIFLAHVVSLLPGTLSADLDGSRLSVHALAGTEAEVARDLVDLEQRVERLFGLERSSA
jgi:multicomponent Na+:H+ antiporter subunit E